MKNILISGGAGFIGSNLALYLMKSGYNITVLDNLSQQIHGENPQTDSSLYQNILGKVEFIKGDVRNKEDWKKAIKKQDIIIHLAAETGTGQSMYEISKYTETNILGTSQMLEVLMTEKHSIKKIILASTRAVYGEGKYVDEKGNFCYPKHRNPEEMSAGNFEICGENGEILGLVSTDENSKIHPSSIYGITKQTQEQMLQAICPSLEIQTTILRFQNVYGEGQSLKNAYTGILSIFSTQILNGENLNIFEDGKESRDFLHIDDGVEAIKLVVENEISNHKIYNVGSGISTNVLEVAENLIKNYKKKVDVNITGQFRIGDIRHNFADISRIKNDLNFESKIDFETGLKRFTDWVSTQKLETNNFQQSLDEMKAKGFLRK
ncbi:NAD-dependent epimerase/dehydratase family protein [Frigoriflavimonas asaccharolytica]|uniref:dTDP-L-rhamnose 4-epimerase n=1 Tax=Frigoriflavimonas asaccharolytica TaxID=2735899 RepID=A0A8J8KAE4_9FLAO|nr:NAD-dependent epimerase/dehydratase family protein [Frigoriflavimonas asaccharolytica]NRS91399.1 dTDP-L-rhamnose 4-epimerase [Frigoriflavimonas asaccharolytica]